MAIVESIIGDVGVIGQAVPIARNRCQAIFTSEEVLHEISPAFRVPPPCHTTAEGRR
jgi:hypothetical protein